MKQMESVALSLLGKFRRVASGNGFTRDFRDDVSEICTYSGLRAKQHTVRVEFDAISDNMTLAGLVERFGD